MNQLTPPLKTDTRWASPHHYQTSRDYMYLVHGPIYFINPVKNYKILWDGWDRDYERY